MALVAGAAWLGLGAMSAEANVYCVAASNPESIDASCTPGQGKTTITAALTAAASNPGEDTVRIGPGNFSESNLAYSTNNPVNIVGSGSIGAQDGGTTVTMPANPAYGYVLSLGSATNHVSHLELRIPKDSNGTTDRALYADTAVYLDDVLISAASDATSVVGAYVETNSGLVMDGTRINMPLNGLSTAIQNSNGTTVTARDSEFRSSYPFGLDGTSATTNVVRSKVTFDSVGFGLSQGVLNISDSLIDMTTSTNYALIVGFAASPAVNTPTATLSGVTIVGGGTNASAVRLRADQNDTVSATVNDSIIDLTSPLTAAFYVQSTGNGGALLNADYVNYRGTINSGNGTYTAYEDGGGGYATLNITHGSQTTPGFIGEGPNPYALSPTSELLDLGNPANSSGLSLGRNPRALDSTGGCSSRRDQGAYEYLPPAPTASIDSGPADGSTITDNTPTFAFSSSRSCAPSFVCSIDGAAASFCPSPFTPAALADGSHTVAVQALGEVGDAGVATSRTFSVDTTAPSTTVSGRSKFKVRGRTGRASFVLGSDDPAATFLCKLVTTGYKPCSKSFTVRLRPGRYTLSVIASDAVGNADPTPAVKKFRVVR